MNKYLSTMDYLKHKFSYRDDGYLIWKRGRNFNQIAGYVNTRLSWNKNGSYKEYSRRKIKLDGKLFYNYRLIWLYHYDLPIPLYIDHIDGNTLNDKIENLRKATSSENTANQKELTSKNKSGLVGVFQTRYGTWEAGIGINGKRVYLGVFNSKTEAGEAYDKAALDYFKDFAVPNTKRV